MSHWATAPLDRTQNTLFSPTLDHNISADHSVRLFEEVLAKIDFSPWELMYVRVVGQPPIHPRVMASALLYGLSVGVRSSRRLEDATVNRLDFIWLLEGHQPDHSTFAKFRTQFETELKDLFRKIGHVAINMGMVTLNQVTLDGTALRSSNSRFNTARRATLEQKLAALDEQIETAFKQAQEKDAAEDQLYGTETSPTKLPRALRELKRRQEQLKEAMKNLESIEAGRAERGERKDLSPMGPPVPLVDPQSRVLPNKEGGYAPNYTGVTAVDSAQGIILDVQVLGGNDEASTVLPAVDAIEENFGQKPRQVGADSGFNSGSNLSGLEQRGVEALMPARQEIKGVNPALREDPSRPVEEKDWAALPISPQSKRLDRSAFIYNESEDQYVCPMGKVLFRINGKAYNHHGIRGNYQMYECASCAGCPLAAKCLAPKSSARQIGRDEHEGRREAMAARMASAAGKEQYKNRAWSSETPFAVLKTTMNFRGFLLRGLKKVTTELRWAATAYNIVKIVRFKASQRASALAAI